MMLPTLVTVLALRGPTSDPDAEFRALLRSLGRERGLAVRVSRSRRTEHGLLPEEAVVHLEYKGPGVFRVETMGAFGDGQLLVSDGSQMMRDPLEGETVFVRSAPKGFGRAEGPASVQGGLPLVFGLLDGEAVFGTLLDSRAKVEASAEGRSTVFTFALATGSQAKVMAEGGRVLRTMLDNSGRQGQGGFRNRPGELVDEVVLWQAAAFPRGRFEVRAPEGTRTVDEDGSP
jgi:hypothetical protein